MADIKPDNIKNLRAITSAGMLDCKKALEASDGDMDVAVTWLREKGIAKAVNKMDRSVGEGAIVSYIHHNNKIGVLLKINCETDFVAKNDIFLALGRDVAMHIAAMSPSYVSSVDVPPESLEKERKIQKTILIQEGKKAEMLDKILEGKIKKYTMGISLLEQDFVKEPKKTVQAIIQEHITKLGENITVNKFVRYSL